MKKIFFVKSFTIMGILGIGGIGISTTLSSCSKHAINLTFNSEDDVSNYFDDHHDTYSNAPELDINNASKDDFIQYFITAKRLSGQNLLYSYLMTTRVLFGNNSISADNPLKLSATVNDTSATFELTSDFTFLETDNDKTVFHSGTYVDANISSTGMSQKWNLVMSNYREDKKQYDEILILDFSEEINAITSVDAVFDGNYLCVLFSFVDYESYNNFLFYLPKEWYPNVSQSS